MTRQELLIAKEKAFTLTESVTMKDWLLAAVTAINTRDRELGKIAEEILDTGLAAEHWLSMLHEDPDQRSNEEVARLKELDAALEKARKNYSEYMRRNPDSDNTAYIERPNAP